MKYVFIYLLVISSSVTAQTLKYITEGKFDKAPNLTINHLFQAANGRIIAVGHRQVDASNPDYTEGVFLIIDELNHSAQAYPLSFRKGMFNSFIMAIEAQSGGFYLVGNTGDSKEKSYGWLVSVDEKGKQLGDMQTFQDKGYFEKAAAFENGSLLFVGQQTDKNLSLNHYKQGNIVPFTEPKNDWQGLSDVVALRTDSSNHVVLIGKQGQANKSLAWIMTVQENTQINTLFNNSSNQPYPEIVYISATEKVYFYAIANALTKNVLWLGRSHTKGASSGRESFDKSTEIAEFHAALPVFQNGHILAICNRQQGRLKNKLIYKNDKQEGLDKILYDNLGLKSDFNITGMVQGFGDTLLVFGNVIESSKKTTFKIIKFKMANFEQDIIGYKGEGITCSTPKYDDSQKGVNKNEMLEPNERGSVVFTITSQMALSEINIEAKTDKNVQGVRFQDGAILSKRLENGRIHVAFPITADDNLPSGFINVYFSIKNKANGKILGTYPASIKTFNRYSTSPEVTIAYKDQSIKSGKKESNTSGLQITPTIITTPKSDITLKVKGAPKDNFVSFKSYPAGNGREAYAFDPIKISLTQEGLNTIYLIVESNHVEIARDTLYVTYNPKKDKRPNLEVLAIAPVYSNLSYNDNDVEDFVAFAKRQENQEKRTMFNKVNIKKLMSGEETTAESIKIAFLELAHRAKPEYEGEGKIEDSTVIWIFISSHGTLIDGQFRVQSTNYNDKNDKLRDLTTVNYRKDILDNLQEIANLSDGSKRKIVVFIDACHSGGAKSKNSIEDAYLSKRLEEVNQTPSGIVTFSSTTDSLLSYEDKI